MISSKTGKEITKRTIALPKAIKIMQDYKRFKYNAYKTLINNGYTVKYALANARYTIEASSDKVKQSYTIEASSDKVKQSLLIDQKDQNSKEISTLTEGLYEAIGLSKQEVLNELVKIIKQDINLAVKLRALEPFIAQEGIKWDQKETIQAPQVAITVKEMTLAPNDPND